MSRRERPVWRRKMGPAELHEHMLLRGRSRQFVDRRREARRRACRDFRADRTGEE